MNTITLAGRPFEVKVSENVRFVKDRGRWLKSTTFVDRLIQEKRLEELKDLAAIGAAAQRQSLTFGSAQQTAKALKGSRTN